MTRRRGDEGPASRLWKPCDGTPWVWECVDRMTGNVLVPGTPMIVRLEGAGSVSARLPTGAEDPTKPDDRCVIEDLPGYVFSASGDDYRESEKCLVTGCQELSKSLGLCSAHYQKYKKYGDPLYEGQRGRSASEGTLALRQAIYAVCRAENPITIRGVYYRMVVQGLVESGDPGYHKVQGAVNDMREGETDSGTEVEPMLPWEWVADNTRRVLEGPRWGSFVGAIGDPRSWFRLDMWERQPELVVVWIEKDAVAAACEPATAKWRVPLFVDRGWASRGATQKFASERLADVNKPVHVFQVGDHDPPGARIPFNLVEKLARYAPDADIAVYRLALTQGQVDEYGLSGLASPLKEKDKNLDWFLYEHACSGYEDRHGPELSVEVDAMNTSDLRALIERAVTRHIDTDIWQEDLEREEEELQRAEEKLRSW